MPSTLADQVIEYIDGLPEDQCSPAVMAIFRMADNHVTARQADGPMAVDLLQSALGSALDNLPDVVGDPLFGPNDVAACCKDIAALSHLLKKALRIGEGDRANVEAYL